MAPALIIALLVFWSTKTSPAVSSPPSITHSTSTPVEVAPTKTSFHWVGADEDPKYISLSTITAEGYIQKVGIDQNNQIAVPNNIHMAAWFDKSAKPSQPGLSIIDGHVNGRVNDGIFKNLDKLKTGDIYTVQFGSGAEKKFKVFKLETVPTQEAVNVLFSQDPTVPSQLNLITCAGTFDTNTHAYDKRLIVSTAYIP